MALKISDEQVMDFLEDEDYDETVAPQTRPEANPIPTVQAPEDRQIAVEAPADRSEDLPASKRQSTSPSGARITEGDAHLLAFVSKFPGADTEAFSIISARQDLEAEGKVVLPTIKGTRKKVKKLLDLGALGRSRERATSTVYYSATKLGINSLWTFGYNAEHAATLQDKAPTRANHYRRIAHVAAQFTSPQGFFRDSLGIEPVALDQLISENEMRGAYEPLKQELLAKKEIGEPHDFGKWRQAAMKHSIDMVNAGRLEWSDITDKLPALLTLGEPESDEKTKDALQPDLVVKLPRTDQKSNDLLVQVELSKKSWADYDSLLRTYEAELKRGFIYGRVVYFTIGSQIETLLRKVDRTAKTNLFSTGRLVVLPILDRDGTPIRSKNRITIQGA